MKSLILLFITSVLLILSSCKEDLPGLPRGTCRLTKETDLRDYSRSYNKTTEFIYQEDHLVTIVASWEQQGTSLNVSADVSYDEAGRLSRLDVDEQTYSVLRYRGDTIEMIKHTPSPFYRDTTLYLTNEDGNIFPLSKHDYVFNEKEQLTDIFYHSDLLLPDPELFSSSHYEYDDRINPHQNLPIIASFINTSSSQPTSQIFFSFISSDAYYGPNNPTKFSHIIQTGNEYSGEWTYSYNDQGYPIEKSFDSFRTVMEYECN
ncbi:MAG: hypothetical protein R8G66_03930 [Cytophagales bacterium]|nr:hypothetical protein [Cytophagales bacterium]